MILGNWDINKQKEVEFLDKLPAMNSATISKIPESLWFSTSKHQLSTVYVRFYFQPSKVKTTFLTPPAAYY